MSAEIPAVLDEYLSEAQDLRTSLPPMPDTQAAPAEVHDYLLDVRRRLDRMEHLLATAVRVRGRVRRAAANATHQADDDWDEAILKVRAAPVRRHDEYSSAKERSAEANLATMTARRAARAAADLASTCDEAAEVLRLLHNGLDNVRRDTLTVLRLVQFESHLER